LEQTCCLSITCEGLPDCDQTKKCAGRPGCDRAEACILACSDPSCVFTCREIDRADYDALTSVAICSPKCPACGEGTTWGCVGKYMIPPPAPTATYTVEIATPDQQLLDNVAVRACHDLACSPPLATATTDASGVAALHLTLDPVAGLNGFHTFLEINDPKTRILPALHTVDQLFGDRIDYLGLANLDYVHLFAGPVDTSMSAGAVMVAGDCTTAPAVGVQFELAPPYDKATVRYLPGGGDRTGLNGTAFVVLPAPLAQDHMDFIVRLAATGEQVGSGWMPLRVGSVSLAFAEPDPAN
jgi:hypothetical protein